MNKYKIEGNIDFFEELYKSLDNEENLDEDTNTCLITNQLLTDKFIQLQCGHKFNYVPLFLDIKNHKQKFNALEGNSTRLDNNEIRCPYCRNKHSGVLPYYEEFGYAKINGVNHYDPSVKGYQGYSYKQCEYLSLNPNYDPSGNLQMETNKNNTGNVKFFVCYASGSKINIEKIFNDYNLFFLGLEPPFFCKIDIEGSEYIILNELVKFSKSISGIVIEFHDVHLNISNILKFIREIDLDLCHIHANNWGGVDSNNVPKVLELTFARDPIKIDNKAAIPHILDQRNNPRKDEMIIQFE